MVKFRNVIEIFTFTLYRVSMGSIKKVDGNKIRRTSQ